MNGNQSRRPARQAEPRRLPPLALPVDRVLDTHARQGLRARFTFDPDDPWVVTVAFLVEAGPQVTWQIGRGLLRHGLRSTSGNGDVKVWRAGRGEQPTAWLRLDSHGLSALFEMPLPPLAAWLDRTYQLVPDEAEMAGVDWDSFLAGLLEDPEVPSA
jgi:hypothetical protein